MSLHRQVTCAALCAVAAVGCRVEPKTERERIRRRVEELRRAMLKGSSIERVFKKHSVTEEATAWTTVKAGPESFGKDIRIFAWFHIHQLRRFYHIASDEDRIRKAVRERFELKMPLTVKADTLRYEKKGPYGLVRAEGNVVLWPVDRGSVQVGEYSCERAVIWHKGDLVKSIYVEDCTQTAYVPTRDASGNYLGRRPVKWLPVEEDGSWAPRSSGPGGEFQEGYRRLLMSFDDFGEYGVCEDGDEFERPCCGW